MLLLPKVTSLRDLATSARSDERYARLAKVAASNLGQPCETLDRALRSLEDCIMETDGDEDGGEDGVVAEINFVRDLVKF